MGSSPTVAYNQIYMLTQVYLLHSEYHHYGPTGGLFARRIVEY